MRKQRARLSDAFSLGPNEAGEPRSVLMLHLLTDIPEPGDVLKIADRSLPIVQTDGHRTRNCLTGEQLDGGGSIAILVNEPIDDLMPLAKNPNQRWATWTPNKELPGSES
jgi:hypothetical protein